MTADLGKTPASLRILVFGYGNPSRQDDGLGPALAAAFETMDLPGVMVDSNYQLTVEDAATVAEYDAVVFADAATEGPEPFSFEPIVPKSNPSFSTHSVQPNAVMSLAKDLFDAKTAGFVLAIRGYAFEPFVSELTERAGQNLRQAIEFLSAAIRAGRLRTGR
ncbi:MAG: hydrogenase maturation protease [Phycisphaerae bacterium]|nr:hydrogenase maturation protease [Phycisphaerae bacterium]